MVSEERLTKALKYLAETDEECARARALVKGLEEQRKTVKALAYLEAEGTNTDRQEKAYASSEYTEHIARLENAIADYELLANKRSTEALIVEVWRSEGANRRRGTLNG